MGLNNITLPINRCHDFSPNMTLMTLHKLQRLLDRRKKRKVCNIFNNIRSDLFIFEYI